MQVKKFEAKTMKEALELVKLNLGPDAIILSAKDNVKGFGLIGDRSVEVTAAISETTLRKKQIAEARMNVSTRQRFMHSPAHVQKNFIEKSYTKMQNQANPPEKRPATAKRYIDIFDADREMQFDEATIDRVVENEINTELLAQERIRRATQEAMRAIDASFVEDVKPVSSRAPGLQNTDIRSLKEEIERLQGIIANFQNVPQSFVNRHPGAEDGISYELSFMYEKLQNAGIDQKIIVEILSNAQKTLPPMQIKKRSLVDAWVAKYILDNVKIAEPNNNRYQLFLGPSGQGKTSSLVKLASRYVIVEKKKIAILTTDIFKVGATEQLRIYSQILNVPFAEIRKKQDWEVIHQKLKHVDYILVDFPSLNLKDPAQAAMLESIMPPFSFNCTKHYVQSTLAKDQDAYETANYYKSHNLSDVIFTCLDESVQHGLIYNFQEFLKIPISAFGIGPQIPEDIEVATKERVVDLIFKLTKIKKERG